MAQKPMYEAVNNSIQTTITASITATDSTIPLASVNGLPEAPNLITIGSDDDAEVVRYNSISGLNLTGCERGFAGTTAKVWLINELVYRAYTKYDHNTFKENIEELAESKLNKTGDASDVTAVFSVAVKRDNIASGEKLSIIAGKIAKWFGDLKALAFKDSVGTSEIAASSITNEKLAENAVNTANLMDGIVTADKLSEKAVTPGKIADNAVGTENLSDGSVTRAKLAGDALYSPVRKYTATSYDIIADDLGKTLADGYPLRNDNITLTMSKALMDAAPVGAEIAFARLHNMKSIKLTTTGARIINIDAGQIGGASATVTLSLPERGSMFALKKIDHDTTNGSFWILTGNVEVEA